MAFDASTAKPDTFDPSTAGEGWPAGVPGWDPLDPNRGAITRGWQTATQGFLGIGEEAGRMAGLSNVMPAPVQNWFDRYRQAAGQSTAQKFAQPTANTLPWLAGAFGTVPARIAEAVPAGIRAGWGALAPATRAAITSGAAGVLAPTEGAINWGEKATQGLVSAMLGTGLGRLADRYLRGQASQKAADFTPALRQGIADAADRARATQAAIPEDTTVQMYREAYKAAGLPESSAPTTVSSASNAAVRKAIGGRLNQIRSQMSLDTGEATSRDLTSQIVSTTQELPLAYRDGWNRTFAKYVLQPIYGKTGALTGKPLADYVSAIGDRAEQLAADARRAPQPDRGPLLLQAQALRNIQQSIDQRAATSPEQLQQLQQANRGYMIWSIQTGGQDIGEAGTPRSYLKEWQRRQGKAGFASRPDPLKDYLQTQRAAQKQKIETP